MRLYEFLKDEYSKISLVEQGENIKNKTFFVTGANGLVGSNIISYLYYLNRKKNLGIKIIAHSLSKPVQWLPDDDAISYLASDLNEGLPDIKFDFLIHAGTYGQPKKFIQNRLGTIKLNTQTYMELLDQCLESNAKVLFISSSEVYGQIPDNELPAKETYSGNVDAASLRGVYAESKRMAETISAVYKDAGLDIKIVRLAIAYGPGVKWDDSRFINEFIKKTFEGKEIKMMDKGEARRAYCFITDAVEMMMNVLFSGKHSLYNIAGTNNKTVAQMAGRIAKLTGTKVIIPDTAQSMDGTPVTVLLDSSRYQNEFHKTSFIKDEEGLNKTIHWLKTLR